VTTIEELISNLSIVKDQQKELANQESLIKGAIMKEMEKLGIGKQATACGNVRLQQRHQKQYSDRIVKMEALLKEEKQLADDLGDYESFEKGISLVFTQPQSSHDDSL
jgi:hypothetical protein